MAKDDETTDEDEAAAKSAKKKKIIGAVVAAALLYNFVLKPKPAPEEEVLPEGVEAVIAEGEVVPIPELVLNLADEDELRYLRVGAAVILEEGAVAADFEPNAPIVSDIMVDLLSSKTIADLRAPGAKEEAKEELSALAREAFDDAVIARIIFTSFVMQ